MNEPSGQGYSTLLLKDLIDSIENGSRPRGGVGGIRSGIPSVGAEHINANGGFNFSEIKFVPEEFFNSLRRGKIHIDDVLVVKDGATTGKTAIVREDFPYKDSAVNEHVFILRANKNRILPEFLFFYMYSTFGQNQIDSNFHGSAQGGINSTFVDNFRIPVPPIETQRKVVEILNSIENIKQKREQANQMANKMLQAVFMQMFGKKKPNNIVGDIAEFVSSGSTPLGGQKTYLSSGIMFIRSQNVQMNEFKLDDVAYISEETHEKMKRTWLKNNDVLLNITGASLGRVAVYRGDDNKANVNQHVCIIRVNKLKALPDYVSYYLSMPNAQREIWTSQAGASRQALNFQQVKKLKLLLPTIEEQRSFVNFMNIVSKIKENQQRSSREIESLFGTLLSEALSGSIK